MNITQLLPEEINNFLNSAHQFVDFCEQQHQMEPNQIVSIAILRLSELYVAAIKLPEVPFRDAPDPPDNDESFRSRLLNNLQVLPFQIYYECLEPTNLDQQGDVAAGDLFDDFLDIYHDISSGLWLVDNGHWEAAVWQWRLLYWHWSNHIIGALRALHLNRISEDAGWFPQITS